MKKITKFALALLCALTFLSTAHADQFGIPWTNIDNYNLGLSNVSGSLSDVDNLDNIDSKGTGIVLADLNTGVFTEYIVYRATSYGPTSGGGIVLGDDSVLNTGYEITFALQLTGISTFDFTAGVLTGLDFSFTNMDLLNIYVDDSPDAIDNDVYVKVGDNQGHGNIGDFVDGTLVLTGDSLVDSGNTDNVGSWEDGQNGKVTTAISLNQEAGIEFLLDTASQDLFDIWDLLAYNIDGDFTPSQQAIDADILDAYASLSVFSPDIAAYLAAASDSNSNIVAFTIDYDSLVTADLGAVPEPATFALFGIGLIGLAGFARRRS